MEGTTFWVLAVIAAVFVGMSKGGLPMAGAVAVPILSLVISPITAAGLLLPVYVMSDILGLYAYRKEFDTRVLWITIVAATAGVCIGWATAAWVDESVVKLIVGVIGLAFVVNRVIKHRVPQTAKPSRLAPGLFWGTLTGFTSFVSHSGGPPFQIYTLPLKLPRTVFAGTLTIAFAYINAIKLIPYYFLGQLNIQNLEIAAFLALPAALSVLLGVWLVKVMSEKVYYRVILVMLLSVSIKLIWDVIF